MPTRTYLVALRCTRTQKRKKKCHYQENKISYTSLHIENRNEFTDTANHSCLAIACNCEYCYSSGGLFYMLMKYRV